MITASEAKNAALYKRALFVLNRIEDKIRGNLSSHNHTIKFEHDSIIWDSYVINAMNIAGWACAIDHTISEKKVFISIPSTTFMGMYPNLRLSNKELLAAAYKKLGAEIPPIID